MINEFRGKYFFLSNFYESPIEYDGIKYNNNEAAFQAQKAKTLEKRKKYATLTPDRAKALGRKEDLRSDWESVKENFMYEICYNKFSQNKTLKQRLLDTGNEMLIEGNDWNDKTWGMVKGEGKNLLGKILMRVRDELRYKRDPKSFDPVATKEQIKDWIIDYMNYNANPNTKVVIGISGGKDSSITAALLVEALGKDRVVGVLMPQGDQKDIDDSLRLVKCLDINYYVINIGDATNSLFHSISLEINVNTQAKINTPARIRMATLYAVAAVVGGRVVNTCNLSEDFVGYSTKFGDSSGDFSPLSNLTVDEVIKIGKTLNIPMDLVEKTPSDGLCGKSDEDNLGFSYKELDTFIREGRNAVENKAIIPIIENLHLKSLHKLSLMPSFII